MICDKCREEIVGAVYERPNGEKWCGKCIRKEKRRPSKTAKSKDPFVMLARRLQKAMRDSSSSGLEKVIAVCGKKRIYTNGHVLISERDTTPKSVKMVDIQTLGKSDELNGYPNIEVLLERKLRKHAEVEIPEELYGYLKAFEKTHYSRICLRPDRITVQEHYSDDGMEMNFYGDFGKGSNVDFNLDYFKELRPRTISVHPEQQCGVVKSYDPTVDACKVVLLMPMQQGG
jgi:hypothetical protein